MGNLYHANAKTTARIRKEIQDSPETIARLAHRLSLNPKTVRYWKQANRVTDKRSGPQHPRSTVLTPEEEQIICEFRRLTRFAFDDVFVSLRDTISTLTRSNLHRCLKRHGLNRLPSEEEEGYPVKNKEPRRKQRGIRRVPIDDLCITFGTHPLVA